MTHVSYIQLTRLQLRHSVIFFSHFDNDRRHRRTYDNTVYLFTACHAELRLGQRQSPSIPVYSSPIPVRTSSIQSSLIQFNLVQICSNQFHPVLPSQVHYSPVQTSLIWFKPVYTTLHLHWICITSPLHMRWCQHCIQICIHTASPLISSAIMSALHCMKSALHPHHIIIFLIGSVCGRTLI